MSPRTRVAVAKPLLDLAIPDAARRVTRAQFDRWCLQSRELAAGTNPDALHDYRTSVRRLRTLLRLLGPWLPALSRGSRRRLRDLMQLTGPARNLEVLLAWIEKHRLSLTSRQRTGARWLSRRIGVRLGLLHGDTQRHLSRKGAKVEARLRTELFVSVRAIPSAPVGGRVIRRLLRQETAILNRRLGAIASMEDRSLIHSARIAAKRVRYLLEPFAIELPDGNAMLQRLRELQELIGNLTDLHVAAEELREALIVANAGRAERLTYQLVPWSADRQDRGKSPAPPLGAQGGLVRLAEILRKEGDEQFEQLETWLGEPKATLMGMLRRAGTVSRGGRI